MFRNVFILLAMTVAAWIIAEIIGLGRRKGWPDHSAWWNGEGVPVFIVVWFLLAVVLIARGCLSEI